LKSFELENPVDFDVLGYTSKIFWHFIRDEIKEDKIVEWTAISRFNSIFNAKMSKAQLLVDPKGDKFHKRILVQSKFNGSLNPNSVPEMIGVLEPRSLCFADIPFNFLPIHLKRYSGIGLGFKKSSLLDRVSDLKPVDYFYSVSDEFKSFFVKNENKEKNEIELKKYSKIPTDNENPVYKEEFEDIYLEREWRTFADLEFFLADLSMVVARTREEKDSIMENKIIQSWLPKGLAVICLDDMFPVRQTKGLKL
jgi:hypothetical protein